MKWWCEICKRPQKEEMKAVRDEIGYTFYIPLCHECGTEMYRYAGICAVCGKEIHPESEICDSCRQDIDEFVSDMMKNKQTEREKVLEGLSNYLEL